MRASQPLQSLAHARAAVAQVGATLARLRREAWRQDRTRLSGRAALVNRAVRILTWTVRGLIRDKLSMRAASLTYYTVFSLVPVLVLAIWIVKALHLSPQLIDILMPAPDGVLSRNGALRAVAARIVQAVERTARLEEGLIGVVAVLYAAIRLLRNMEQTLNAIAGAGKRRAHRTRLLGYLIMLLLPAATFVAAAGLIAAHALVDSPAVQAILVTVRKAIPSGAGLALLAVWCTLTTLYAAAARAGLRLASCAAGAAIATALLVGVLWAFARFQIGAARAGAVQSGLSAAPVFLLWVYFSWFVTLIGAEVAVAHEVDRTLARGACAWRLDARGRSWAALAIMAAIARHTARPGAPASEASELAGELKLFPDVVHSLCRILVSRGLLVEADVARYRLVSPSDSISAAAIVDAVNRDPALDSTRTALANSMPPAARLAVDANDIQSLTLDELSR